MEGQPPSNRSLPAGRMERKRKRHDPDDELQEYSSVSKRIMPSMGYRPGEGLGRSGTGIKRHDADDDELQEYSSVSKRIMASMGYRPGEGLGRSGTGITAPITEGLHKGRRGLGYYLEGLEKEDVKWELEEVSYHQKVEWLHPCELPVPTASELTKWMRYGERKDTIDDETSFCDPVVLHKILDSKSVFDNLANKEFIDARQRSNPFETIKGAIFQNRAAMKMANIDAVFNFMFTNPKKRDGSHLLNPFDVLYFADICAGPGGFSEYVLWRKKWHAKGFGLTLKEPDSASDFKLDAFLAAPCETFDPHYGVGGYDGDGDITSADNLMAFQDYVLEQTGGKGVHFVMADGGISVEGQENIQEILTKQLVLCQYVCALSILRNGGHFLCKVFDMFTPFSVGLFYLLYRCFKQVCIFKPVTSRPANSERYVVCYEFLPGSSVVHNYLFHVNQELCRLKEEHSKLDILEVVPMEVLHDDEGFNTYIKAFNDSFGVNQTVHLKKLQYFVKNANLVDLRQAEIRRKCLDLWHVPVGPRTAPSENNPLQVFNELWKQLTPVKSETPHVSVLQSSNFTPMNKDSLEFFKDIYSWKWGWACGKRLMLVGMGRNMVYAWDIRGTKPLFGLGRDLPGLELPRGTVLEVELVSELEGEGRGQKKRDTVYIVDVIAIHGTVYGNKNLKERQLLANKLCKVVNKPCRKGTILLKTKTYYRCAELQHEFTKLSLKDCKGQVHPVPTYQLSEDQPSFIAPVGVIMFKMIKDPWQLHLSKTGKFYYFNSQTGTSTFECPGESVAPYLSVSATKHFWMWNKAIFEELCSPHQKFHESTELTRSYLCDCIDSYKTKSR